MNLDCLNYLFLLFSIVVCIVLVAYYTKAEENLRQIICRKEASDVYRCFFLLHHW